MAAFKNKDNGTWYVQFRYTDSVSYTHLDVYKRQASVFDHRLFDRPAARNLDPLGQGPER